MNTKILSAAIAVALSTTCVAVNAEELRLSHQWSKIKMSGTKSLKWLLMMLLLPMLI